MSDLEKIAKLAYLSLDPLSIPTLGEDVQSILQMVSALAELDTTGVQPSIHPYPLQQRLREDVVYPEAAAEHASTLSANFAEAYYRVPKIIERES